MKIIPIPVGYKIRYELGGKSYNGIINKVMMPGYKFHMTPDSNDTLRYCITRCDDPNCGAIIHENMIKEPNIWKLYFDEDYKSSMLSKFKDFTVNKPKKLNSIELLNLLARESSNITGGDFKIRILDKEYFIQSIMTKYNKVTISTTNNYKYKMSNGEIINSLIACGSEPNQVSIQYCECGISGLIINKNPIFIGEF